MRGEYCPVVEYSTVSSFLVHHLARTSSILITSTPYSLHYTTTSSSPPFPTLLFLSLFFTVTFNLYTFSSPPFFPSSILCFLLTPSFFGFLSPSYFVSGVTMEYLDLEEGSGETNEIKNLCVVGKVLSNKPCHVSAVSNVCNIAWKTRAPFSVVPWGNNIFLFRFEEAEDKDHILKDGLWSISNNLLILEPLEIGGTVEDLEFSHCPFWIQIHGLPVEKMTRANAELIGKRLGKLLAVETSHDGILLGRS